MATEALSQAFTSSRQVLASVTTEQLHGGTPCRSWDVAALINHMVGAPRTAVGALTTTPADDADDDFAAGDFMARYDETAAAALAAFGAPGALEKTVVLPFGELPASLFMMIIASDQYTHGWDLARATGQSTDLDPVLGAQFLTMAQGVIVDDFRGEDGQKPFGPEQEAPTGASAADRLAAFLGRSV